MSISENIWSLCLLAVVLLSVQVFKRLRRGTEDFRASAEFKARLPVGVKRFETLTLCALAIGAWLAIGWIYFHVFPSPQAMDRARQGAGALYFGVGTWAIALPLALLCANLLSWLLPPVRAANLRAMAGLSVSFWTMNRGLLQFGAVSIPIGLGVLVLAALAPWTP